MKMSDGLSEHEVSDYDVMAKELAPSEPELHPHHPGGKYIQLGPITFGFDTEDKLESVQIHHYELGFSNLFREGTGSKWNPYGLGKRANQTLLFVFKTCSYVGFTGESAWAMTERVEGFIVRLRSISNRRGRSAA